MATLTEATLPLDAIFKHHLVQVEALGEYRAAVLSSVGLAVNPRYALFEQMTSAEVYDAFELYEKETRYSSILSLLASIEAFIRVDFNGKRRAVGQFRSLYSQYAKRTPLDGILEAWSLIDQHHKAWVSKYRDLLHLRHWLAHGRYWNQNVGRNDYSPELVYDIAIEIFGAIVNA